MNYVISYWLSPDSSPERERELRRYFDLQCYTKEQFGARQLIVTNIDYPGAIPFVEPPGFSREYAFFAKQFGVAQLIDSGFEFPFAVHDHDMFIRNPLPASESAILCSSKSGHCFSDQLVIYPQISKEALLGYVNLLKTFDFDKGVQTGYGCETRHEKMYSSEVTLARIKPNPFIDIPVEIAISFRDLVSFDILDHHSLDPADCECNPVPDDVQAVHGHLNKGPATDALIKWLAQ